MQPNQDSGNCGSARESLWLAGRRARKWLAAATATDQLWAEGSRGSLLTRVCSESSLALCSSESNFSISRGRRNCREKHFNSAHPLHHLSMALQGYKFSLCQESRGEGVPAIGSPFPGCQSAPSP